MRKIYLLLLTLLCAVGGVLTANAGFRIPYKSSGYWEAFNGTVPTELQTAFETHKTGNKHISTTEGQPSTTGTLHYHSCPVTVTKNGDITVKVASKPSSIH